MRRVFGAKKQTEPPPSIQDASDRGKADKIIILFAWEDLGLYVYRVTLVGRVIEVSRRASMLLTHALMGFGKDPSM